MGNLSKIFNSSSLSTFDEEKIEISNLKFQLKLQEVNVDFTELFDNDTGFTYNSNLAQFITGEVRQIDKRPIDAKFYSSFTNNENGSWGDGTLTGTLGGTANVHDGYLDLTSGGYIEYPIDNFSTMQGSAGCVKIRLSFDYSGASPSIQYIIQTSPNANSRVYLVHNSTFIQCYITNTGGTTIYSMVFSWTPSQGTIYNFEVNWNSTHGYFFINGQLQDSDTGSLGIAAPSLFRIGSNSGDKLKIYDVAVFSTLQHSSNFSPSWSEFYETIYLENNVVLPEMEHTGDGFIKFFNSLSVNFTGIPRLLIEIGRSGNNLYWDGDSWEISDNTYEQSTDITDFIANCTLLDVEDQKYGQFTLAFTNSNTLSSVSELTANLKINLYPIDNPKIQFVEKIGAQNILSFLATIEVEGNNQVTFTVEKDSVEKYYNSGWVNSNGDYTESNILTEVIDNITTLFGEGELGSSVSFNFFLHSDTGGTTPSLTNITINYDFYGIDDDVIEKTIIYGFIKDSQEDKQGKIITARLNKDQVQYKEKTIYQNEIFSTISESDGYWELTLPDTDNMESGSKYIITIDGKEYYRKIPDPDTCEGYTSFWELEN
jgi:hypothetical protein